MLELRYPEISQQYCNLIYMNHAVNDKLIAVKFIEIDALCVAKDFPYSIENILQIEGNRSPGVLKCLPVPPCRIA